MINQFVHWNKSYLIIVFILQLNSAACATQIIKVYVFTFLLLLFNRLNLIILFLRLLLFLIYCYVVFLLIFHLINLKIPELLHRILILINLSVRISVFLYIIWYFLNLFYYFFRSTAEHLNRKKLRCSCILAFSKELLF